jgi:hypothetical protein
LEIVKFAHLIGYKRQTYRKFYSVFQNRREKSMGENVKILLVIVMILMAVVPALTGCATLGTVRVEGESGSVTIHQGERYYRDTPPDIPPGHMPPPGKCRIWYPDRPPGQQPPPGDCRELEYMIPPGAWLIRGE